MVISICGDNNYKDILVDKIISVYGDNIFICDYFKIKFNSIIDTEKYKYELLDSTRDLECAIFEYSQIIEKTVKSRMEKYLEENKDKIIILTNDNFLNKDFYDTEYFIKSDIKVLIDDNINNYNKTLFDYIYSDLNDIDVRKLVKI